MTYPEPEVIKIEQPQYPAPKPRDVGVFGRILAFIGRDVVPRLAEWLLDSWDRRKEEEARALAASLSAYGLDDGPASPVSPPPSGQGPFRHRHGRSQGA